ncbi:MAG TPA: hypothetical protein VJU77_10650 [Chthoniobacterales bacterium]|nr:hypothetical protein [Chthoniobacterales bacterium]
MKKHVHDVFEELGVENRTAAAALYWRWRASVTTDGNNFPHIAQASE